MRPLSPHLLIYKIQLTSIMSIMHRITGMGFIAAIYLFLWWLYANLNDEETLFFFINTIYHPVSKIILFGVLFAACFHFFNGIRYLIWSLGIGFDLKSVYLSSYIILLFTVLSTLYIWTSL